MFGEGAHLLGHPDRFAAGEAHAGVAGVPAGGALPLPAGHVGADEGPPRRGSARVPARRASVVLEAMVQVGFSAGARPSSGFLPVLPPGRRTQAWRVCPEATRSPSLRTS